MGSILTRPQLLTPPTIGLNTWWKPDFLENTDADLPATLLDGSKNASVLATTLATKPVFHENVTVNGKLHSSLRFGGTNSLTSPTSLVNAVTQPFTLIMIIKHSAAPTADEVIIDALAATANGIKLIRKADGSFSLGAGGTAITGGSNIDSNWHCYRLQLDGASSKMYMDGVQQLTGNPGTNGFEGITLGMSKTGTSPFIGDIADVLVYDHVVSTNEQSWLTNYIAQYGLVAI